MPSRPGKTAAKPRGIRPPGGASGKRPAKGTAGRKSPRPSPGRGRTLTLVLIWLISATALASLVAWGTGVLDFSRYSSKVLGPPTSSSHAKRAEPPHPGTQPLHSANQSKQQSSHSPITPQAAESRPEIPKPLQANSHGAPAPEARSADARTASPNQSSASSAALNWRDRPSTPPIQAAADPTNAPAPQAAIPDAKVPHVNPEPDRLALARTETIPSPPAPPAPPPVKPSGMARVAIVIDDLGQDINIARRFLALPVPVTCSVLPNQRYSSQVADLAHSKNLEVILHLPMEPDGYPQVRPGPGALLISMDGDRLRSQARSALDTSTWFAGANNHMGSKFTEYEGFMTPVLEELRRRNLYFLDSCTSPRSVAYKTARGLNLRTIKRDLFLDHDPSETAVRAQVEKLIRKARVEGTAIAIGHPREATLRALTQATARFRAEGIEIVPASALIGGKNAGG